MRKLFLATAFMTLCGCAVNHPGHPNRDGGIHDRDGGSAGAGGEGGSSGGAGGSGGSGGSGGAMDLAAPCHSTDPNQDVDGDGFTGAQGDCDDCNPEINPNAVEVPGDKLDNDCNGKVDEPIPGCDMSATGKKDPTELAHSMELCDPRFFKGASMNGPSDERARNVLGNFGVLKPRVGASFTLLSNGVAVDENGTDFKKPQEGTDLKTADFSNPLPNLQGASDCGQSIASSVKDYSEVSIKLKAPSNAHSLQFDFQFFSGEYPVYVCTMYNDEFLAIMQSTKSYPTPTNVSYDEGKHPITVNSGFFTVCENWVVKPQTQHCKRPSSDNSGTGYEIKSDDGVTPSGGSTGWLSTTAPVEPNEEITLRFVIFDESDGILDSAVLIDNVRWGAAPADPGTGPIG